MLLFVLFDYVCFSPLAGKSGSSRLEVKFINQIKSIDFGPSQSLTKSI